MTSGKQKLSLDRPAAYQIKVPGKLDRSWIEFAGNISLKVEVDKQGSPVTTLSCAVDQAALQGILRQLYALGLPLISVNWVPPTYDSDEGS
jgi:hypothetical protein